MKHLKGETSIPHCNSYTNDDILHSINKGIYQNPVDSRPGRSVVVPQTNQRCASTEVQQPNLVERRQQQRRMWQQCKRKLYKQISLTKLTKYFNTC